VKKTLQKKLERVNKETLIDKETMTDPVESRKLSEVKIQTMEIGTNSDLIDTKN
jgi:hypothetical protein